MGYLHDFGNLQMATNGVAHPQFSPVSPTLQHQSWHPPVQPFSRHATHVACRPIGVRDAIARRPRCKPLPFARPSESFHASPVARHGLHPGGYRTGEILMTTMGPHWHPLSTSNYTPSKGIFTKQKTEKNMPKKWKSQNFIKLKTDKLHDVYHALQQISLHMWFPRLITTKIPHLRRPEKTRAQKPCLLVYLPMLAKSTITRH